MASEQFKFNTQVIGTRIFFLGPHSLYGKEQCEHSSKHLLLCSTEDCIGKIIFEQHKNKTSFLLEPSL